MRGELLVSELLYGALLNLYPKKFRAAYGQQMLLTFRDACRAAYRLNGASGLLALWLPTLLDLVKSALEERAQQGEITMSKTRLIALASPLTILVGSLWLVPVIGDFVLRIGTERAENFWDLVLGLWSFAFFFSFVPLLFALIGTRLRFHPSAGILGRLGLALSVAGSAGLIVSMLANLLSSMAPAEVEQVSWMNYAAWAGFQSLMLGYILFGVDALRYRLLPRWNVLPLLLGSTIVLSFTHEMFGVPALLPSPLETPFLQFALTGACWVLLGIALINPRQEPQPTAAI
jgi:hypothetical protein